MLAHRRAAERHRRADELVVPLLGPSAQELDLLPVLGRLDAALLLLPRVGFVEYEDERMVRTARTIREELDDDGLIKRYRTKGYEEGAFLACSFWLAECFARQGLVAEARKSSTAPWPAATTWASSPRSTTRTRRRCLETSPRASPTSRT